MKRLLHASLSALLPAAAIVLTGTVLSGCATSAAFTLVSMASSGLSLAATGKSLSDHAISVVLERDCALWRVVADRPVCTEQPYPDWTVDIEGGVSSTLASANETFVTTHGDDDRQPPSRAFADVAGVSASTDWHHAITTPLASSSERGAGGRRLTNSGGQYLIILGSFGSRSNAERLAGTVARAHIMPITVRERAWYRVALGPVHSQGPAELRQRAARRFGDAVWVVDICTAQPAYVACPGMLVSAN